VSVSAVGELQERPEVWDVPRVTLLGVRVHVRLPVVVTVRATVPVKPLIGETVMVEVPATPVLTETLVGLAEMVKSGAPVTMYVTDAECESEPLVPVTVTV
jgi:hypothetical protein